ncbi:hypothetical protein [Hyalangium versicolor]|uniref:hypothetical protein n=1 Tax=Hyalangium versicolor TaxID=2861190 RepID=UPI001CCC42D3|nr:hypothetical protein [Hyalangium versicolor]
MEVKGVAFLARQLMMIQEQGEEAWQAFFSEYAVSEPLFAQPVMPVTRMPVEAFLRFNEALVDRFYNSDPKIYWQFGVKSAEYALIRGQLKTMFGLGDMKRFLLFTPGIWKGYFTAGELLVRPEAEYTELRITGVPRPHPYFELSVMGFAAGGLQVLGAKNLQHEVVKGFTRGHPEVVYRFRYE